MNSNVKTASRIIIAVQAAMLLACILVVSNASADDQVRAETVKFADLNVNTPEGVAALYRRIHQAANRVCAYDGFDQLLWIGSVDCARKSEAEAVGKVALPQLTAYYEMKTGKHTQPLSASR
jgi:UrcA family protein